jgi:hypothetical protein
MAGRSKTLNVTYFTQPTSITCQSTCLKMYANYLARRTAQSSGAANVDIQDIWKAINTGTKRPYPIRNHHRNMLWWLKENFPGVQFQYITTNDQVEAVESIVRSIDCGNPVMVSISHADVEGHIILVVGYRNYVSNASTPDFSLVVHDPYGRFDPSLTQRLYGDRRWVGGSSLMGGGEAGPGSYVSVPLDAAARSRKGDKARGTFYLMSAI